MSTRRVLQIHVNSATGLISGIGKPSAHVALTLDGRTRETVVIKGDCNPSWHNVLEFDFEPKEDVSKMTMEIQVIDNGILTKSKIGYASVEMASYVDGDENDLQVELMTGKNKDKPAGTLSLSIKIQEPAKPSKTH